MSKLTSKLYSGAATIGRVYAIVGAIIMGIIILILLVNSRNMYKKATRFSKISPITAKIINIDPTTSLCDVEYVYNNTKYTKSITCNNTTGKSVKIWINDLDYTDVTTHTPESYRKSGKMLLWISLILTIITVAMTYFSLKYKAFAALEGAEAGMSGIKNILF